MIDEYEIAACPACEGTESEEVADREGLRREMEELWGFHLRRLRPDTPPERLSDRVVFSQDPPLRLARCSACGTVFRNPRERSRSLLDLYGGEEMAPEVLGALFEAQAPPARAQARRLTRIAGKAGSGLEVGSYVGAFLAAARAEGWDFEGVDVNASAVSFSRGRGLRALAGSLEELDRGRSYDAVAIWNCFDQLPRPRATTRAARSLLAPGGVLAIRVPNGGYYAALRPRLDGPAAAVARAALAHNNLLGFPYRQGFTPDSLGALLRGEGFEVVSVVGDALVPMADGWTRGWAVWEERLLKSAMRALAAHGPKPWFEIYARVPNPR